MNRKLRHTIILLFICTLQVYGQAGDKEEKKIIKEAETYFEDGDYKKAFPLYFDLYTKYPEDPQYNFCLGVSYLSLAPNKTKSISKEKSIPHLELANKSLDMIDISYYLGAAYHLNYQWDKAIEHYQAYIDSLSLKEPYYLMPLLIEKEEFARIEHRIEMCENGKILMQDTTDITFENMGIKVNSSFPDYAPAISADNEVLIFTSRRAPKDGKGKLDEDFFYYEDIFITYKKDGEWVEAIRISDNINTKKHNASIGLSADAQTLFVYEDGDIYISELDGTEWSKPEKLGNTINTPDWETHVSITSAQNTIYFVSDRKGGYGGRDIYKAYKMKDGSWGNVENLGPTVNTPFDEESPFIHPDDRHLYFSSNGHNSMGGFDIFYTKLRNGAWSKPVNMGYPINTPGDDIYFTVSSNGKNGYLSTIREGGLGEKDVFIANMPDTGEVPLTVIRGLIKGLDGKPIKAEFIVTDKGTGEVVGRYSSNSVSGKYLLVFPPNNDYEMVIAAENYVPHAEGIAIPDQNRFYDLFQEIQLTQAIRTETDGSDSVVGQQIVVRNAFFDIDSAIALADKGLKSIDEKELAYSYFLGNLELSSDEEKKEIAEKVAGIEGVSEGVKNYEPKEQVHITELASDEDLERHVLGYDTLYATSVSTSTIIDVESLAKLDIKVEDATFVSREAAKDAEYHPEDYFVSKGLKEGIEEVLQDVDSTLAMVEETKEVGEDKKEVTEETKETVATSTIDDLDEKLAEINEKTDADSKVEVDEKTSTTTTTTSSSLINSKFVLSNIYFDLNSSTLNANSKTALDKLWATLDKATDLQVEISGHTCNLGEAVFNQTLSEARARTIVNYLIAKGIASSRLVAKGYGAAEPIASNDTKTGRKQNRRTELKVLDVNGKVAEVAGGGSDTKAGDTQTSGSTGALSVSEGEVCTSIVERAPIGAASTFKSSVGRIYYFTKIVAPSNEKGSVKHVWYYGEKKMAEVSLKYQGPQWRTNSSKAIAPSWTGKWKVEVVSESGTVLKSTSFTVE